MEDLLEGSRFYEQHAMNRTRFMLGTSPKEKTVARTEAEAAKAYLRSLPAGPRASLNKLRRAIAAAAPDATLGFSYRIPALRLNGRPLVWFAAFKGRCSFFPGAAAIRAHAAHLKNYKTSKGAIQFPIGTSLPDGLVAKLVRTRIKGLEK
jgi:uncharacterized protein YdhG (YjbR/CyaY superfamily)